MVGLTEHVDQSGRRVDDDSDRLRDKASNTRFRAPLITAMLLEPESLTNTMFVV